MPLKDRRRRLASCPPRDVVWALEGSEPGWRWALIEATMDALRHPAYAERYQRTKRRLGRQRGAKVAQIEIARRLAHAIWHMLTSNQEFAPRGAAFVWRPDRPFGPAPESEASDFA